ncbi:MAG: hypothetical protein R2764_03975 [Bacteroidales bacterium]
MKISNSSNDLSGEHPEKLKELQDLFMKEGEKYHVLPIDDRLMERIIAESVGRPDIMEGRTSLTLADGMTGIQKTTLALKTNRLQLQQKWMSQKMEGMVL